MSSKIVKFNRHMPSSSPFP